MCSNNVDLYIYKYFIFFSERALRLMGYKKGQGEGTLKRVPLLHRNVQEQRLLSRTTCLRSVTLVVHQDTLETPVEKTQGFCNPDLDGSTGDSSRTGTRGHHTVGMEVASCHRRCHRPEITLWPLHPNCHMRLA